jgi:hypothetical protein
MTRPESCLAGLAINEAGLGQPAVLLHGSASSGKQWRSLALALAERFRLVMPDLCTAMAAASPGPARRSGPWMMKPQRSPRWPIGRESRST